jgi:hypothetical protein
MSVFVALPAIASDMPMPTSAFPTESVTMPDMLVVGTACAEVTARNVAAMWTTFFHFMLSPFLKLPKNFMNNFDKRY